MCTTTHLELAKGGLLGFVVFTVYDMLIQNKEDARNGEQVEEIITAARKPARKAAVFTADLSVVPMYSSVRSNKNESPLIAHFGAGALSGLAFSMVQDGWDFVKRARKRGLVTARRSMNQRFVLRRLVHHSVGYATMFGSFECFRRLLMESIQTHMTSSHDSVPSTLKTAERLGLIRATNANQLDMTAVPILTSFVAGGLAGQAHFIADHYTRSWKLRAIQTTSKVPPLPVRSLLGSFLPTALCFVAFQYGPDLYDRFVEDELNVYPFPEI